MSFLSKVKQALNFGTANRTVEQDLLHAKMEHPKQYRLESIEQSSKDYLAIDFGTSDPNDTPRYSYQYKKETWDPKLERPHSIY